MVDPVRYRSDRLPTAHFDARFSEDNLRFWVPVLVEVARIDAGTRVLDVGCGTGGFARGIADAAAATVTGCDVSKKFLDEAKSRPAPARGRVDWVVADAEHLPFGSSSFDRVLFSLVLHQLADPAAAVRESFRVLRAGGLVLVRTIAPEDVHSRVPERYLPRMAAVDAARLPDIDLLRVLLEAAGFVVESVDRVLRNKVLILEEQEQELLTEASSRYEFLTEDELSRAVRRMREDAAASEGDWVDPRPTMFVVASKPR
jgi:ubiquinone/menaquinone biosynthesis C-methylase UbiE